jgi:hypothetical protein
LTSQDEQPVPFPANCRAAIASEYNTKYNTKGDNTRINEHTTRIAATLNDPTKTADRKKTSLLSMCLNLLNKSIAYPLVMSAYYVCGYGDSWNPMPLASMDIQAFQTDLQAHASAFVNPDVNCTLLVADADDRVECPRVAAVTAATFYRYGGLIAPLRSTDPNDTQLLP